MGSVNPVNITLEAYIDSMFEFVFVLVDPDGNPIDIGAIYSLVQFRIFQPYKQDTPALNYTTDDDLVLAGLNNLSGVITEETLHELSRNILYWELRFFFDGERVETYLGGVFKVNHPGGGGEKDASYTVTINQVTNETKIESADTAALAIDAEQGAKAAEAGAVAALQETEQVATQALTDITTVRDDALAQLETAETNSIDAINTAASNGVTAVNAARDLGVQAVNNAKDQAVTEITDLVTAAQTAAQAAAESEQKAKTSETNAAASATAAAGSATTATEQATKATQEADRAEQEANSIYPIEDADSVIAFDRPRIFGTPTAPITEVPFAYDVNPKIGVIQKIYHKSDPAPALADKWIKIGTNDYVPGELNIIRAEWVTNERVEYWIELPETTAEEEAAERLLADDVFYFNQRVSAVQGIDGLPPGVAVLPTRPELENPALTFSRASEGMRWNELGQLESVPADKIRYNFNPATGVFEGRLIEPQRTNYMGISNMRTRRSSVGNAIEEKGLSGFIYNATDTLPNVDIIPEELGVGFFCLSVIVSAGATTSTEVEVVLGANGSSTRSARVSFNFNTKTFSGLSVNGEEYADESHGYVDLGDNIYRVWISAKKLKQTTVWPIIYWDNDSSIGILQSQFEEGGSESLPIITDGTPKTRSPDIATVTDLSAIDYNHAEGTFVVEAFAPLGEGDFTQLFNVTDGTDNNRLALLRDAVTGELYFQPTVGGSTTQIKTLQGNPGNGTRFRVAVAIDEDGYSICLNGGEVNTYSVGMPTNLTRMLIGHKEGPDKAWNAPVLSFPYYPRRFTNDQLQAVTSI